ncbi:heavy metal-associated isoprenylated plant protein 34-like [Miscanthus floridulus]|uniref:heavy metal-associated isoprenylated plant protein 34-like n=1 Tax=Miscanthus floridulus TaxID=154761 RepID=UPI003457E1C3
MSTVVMRVDLECEKCYKKIRKVLCKVQDKVSIRTISYDEKNNTVTVSGPFDAEEVADRLTSDAGKVITDIHVVGGLGGFGLGGGGGGGKQKHGAAAATPGKAPKPGKANGNGQGQGQGQGHGHGGHGGGGGHGGHGGGGHGGHGGGGKTEKKHVKFDDMDLDMDDDDFDLDDMDEPAGRHAHSGHGSGGGKPKIIMTNTPIAARLEAPHTGPAMSMAAAAPVRMPMTAMGPMPQQQVQHAQGMGVPSIWPAAPEWGYSTQPYGSYSGPPAGGYYGGGGPAGHWPGAYGRNPYAQQQYYEEEPSAACSVM